MSSINGGTEMSKKVVKIGAIVLAVLLALSVVAMVVPYLVK